MTNRLYTDDDLLHTLHTTNYYQLNILCFLFSFILSLLSLAVYQMESIVESFNLIFFLSYYSRLLCVSEEHVTDNMLHAIYIFVDCIMKNNV